MNSYVSVLCWTGTANLEHSVRQAHCRGNFGFFLEVKVRIWGRKWAILFLSFVERRRKVSLVTVSFHELLDSCVTVSFVITECDFSLLCYRIFWLVVKGFVLDAALRHAHLTWSFPSVPAVQLYKKAAGRQKAVAGVPKDKSIVLSLQYFWGGSSYQL